MMATSDYQADGRPPAHPGIEPKPPGVTGKRISKGSPAPCSSLPVWTPLAGAFQEPKPWTDGTQGSSTDFHPRNPDSVLHRCTRGLTETYKICSAVFQQPPAVKPRRLLTNPSEGCKNGGADNENSDLILAVDDVFQSSSGRCYVVTGMLGQGTFGQVAQCRCDVLGVDVAVKVIKNQPAYCHQAQTEIGVLQLLNQHCDPEDKRHIVRLLDYFIHKEHLCLVFELLSVNLYELVKHNQFQGLSMNLLRVLMTQILDALVVLRDAHVIHCDLKPENVLLKGLDSGEIKVIDFGSACFESRTVYSYIQSRFYRSPEVLLGHPYTVAIDMWSFGCVAAEMFLGLPLFPGASEYDLLTRIIEMLGALPATLLANAKNTKNYFKQTDYETYLLLTQKETEERIKMPAPLGKKYFKHSKLADIVGAYPMRPGIEDAELAIESQQREAFLDLLLGVLDLDPMSRWTPRQAMQHPFITGSVFDGPFQPEPDPAQPLSGNSSPLQIPGGSQAASPAQNSFGVPWGVSSAGAMGGSLGASSLSTSHGVMMAGSPAQMMHAQAQAQAQAHAHAAAMAVISQMSPQINTLGRAGGSSSLPGAYGRSFAGHPPSVRAQAMGVDPLVHAMLSPQQNQQYHMGYTGAMNSLPGAFGVDSAAQRAHQHWTQYRLQHQSGRLNMQPPGEASNRQHFQQQPMGMYQGSSLPSQNWQYQQQHAIGSPYHTGHHFGGQPYQLHQGSLGAHTGAGAKMRSASYRSNEQIGASSTRAPSMQDVASASMGTTPTQPFMQGFAQSPAMDAASMAAAAAAQNPSYSQHQAAIVAQAAAHAAAYSSSLAGKPQLSGSYGSQPFGTGHLGNTPPAAVAAMQMSGSYHTAAAQRRNSLDVAAMGRHGMYGSVPGNVAAHKGMQSHANTRGQYEAAASSWQDLPPTHLQGNEGRDSSFSQAARPYPEAKAVLNQRLASEPPGRAEEDELGVEDRRDSPEAGDPADYLPFFSDDQLIEDTESAPSASALEHVAGDGTRSRKPISPYLPVRGMDRLALSTHPSPQQEASGKVAPGE